MAYGDADLLTGFEDDSIAPPLVYRRPVAPLPTPAARRGVTVEALAWGALVLLTLGPLIGFVLAAFFF
jgi:hypothetical protein